ncbi:CDP-glucose 4,6-dehydratase [bacterium]|nr:CDP-glucose 4,6-dehydratase [bacterium]
MFANSFNGKRILVTGHTGFKGSWLCEWLLELGAEVHGLSLPPTETQNLFRQLKHYQRISLHHELDVRNLNSLKRVVADTSPDFLFHLAAQPLVRKSYADPVSTIDTNVIGTVNILEALREFSKFCTAIIVTTDKCYENREWLHSYRESDALGGYDPYSASKACAELVTHSYRQSFFSSDSKIRVASARAGNVIGGGDWAEDRIVPDIIKAIRTANPIEVRNRVATRPWQHVLEPLSGYLWLAAKLSSITKADADNIYRFNFGPNLEANRSVSDLVEEFLKHTTGTWVDKTSPDQPHEAGRLNLSIDHAYHQLGWQPCWNFSTAVKKTSQWYEAEFKNNDLLKVTQQHIADYSKDATEQSLIWAS